MRIRRIDIEGFRSWRAPQSVDLTGKTMVAIAGDNRAGKTSLLAAVEFALWGATRGSSVTAVINRHCAQAKVALEFESNAQIYRVERTRTRAGRHEVLVCVLDNGSWTPLAEKHPSVADPVIVSVVGMDERRSTLTWLVRQNDYAAFCALAPAARRQVLVDSFGLDRFSVLAQTADNLRRDAQRELDHAQWTLDSETAARDEAQAQLGSMPSLDDARRDAELAWSNLEKASAQWAQRNADRERAQEALDRMRRAFEESRRQVADKRADLAGRLGSVNARLDVLNRRKAKADQAAADVVELESATGRLETVRADIEDKLDELGAQLEDQRTRRSELGARRSALASRAEQLDQRLAGLARESGGTCVVCDSSLSAAKAAKLRTQAETEREDVEAELRRNAAESRELETSTAALESRIGEGRARLSKNRASFADTGAELARARTLAATTWDSSEADELVTERDRLASRLASLTDPMLDQAEADRLQGIVETEVSDERDRYRAESERANQQLHSATALTEALAGHDSAIEQAGVEVARHRQYVDDLTTVRDAFRPSGIPSVILAGLLDELNAEAETVMEQTADDGLSVRVSTQRVSTKGSAVDEVTITALAQSGDKVDFSALSGSEQFRVSLALRIALCRCMSRRTGIPIRLLEIDEGWGNLDESTRTNLVSVLRRLSDQFQILTVSHIDDVKDAFDTIVRVDASSGTSVATVV